MADDITYSVRVNARTLSPEDAAEAIRRRANRAAEAVERGRPGEAQRELALALSVVLGQEDRALVALG